MDKIWAYIIDTVIAVFIIFVSVTIYFGLRTETVMKSIGKNITEEFMSEVKRNGSITAADYEKYMDELHFTDSLYNIEFEHMHSVIEPEYRFRTIEEIIAAQKAAYTGTNIYHYRDIETVRPEVIDPINDGNLNTETNESVLAAAINTPASSSHVHTEECYAGHRHIGTYTFTHTHQHTNDCREYEQIRIANVKCKVCGALSQKTLATWYWDSASESVKLGYAPGGDSRCWVCDSSNTTVTYISGYGYSCGYNKDMNNDGIYDAVGKTRPYEYIRTAPQDTSIKKTYTSGCYAYNNEVSINTRTNDGYYYFYDKSDFWNLCSKGISAYCYVPEIYTIRYSYDENNYIEPRYRLQFNNGQAIFVYEGGTNINIYDHFPSVTLQKLYTLATNKYALYDYLVANAHQTYIYHYDNCSVYFYGMSGRIKVCNHTSHNTWYTTCGLEENGVLACNQIIQSIIPTHPVQTVATGDPLITTAIATYRDGSTQTIECSSAFDTSAITENQNVTLTYTSLINGIQYQNSCAITVTVIPRTQTCSNGHTYNLREDGSDPGCPYCREWIENLRLLYPTTSAMMITIGTTLQENGVTLLATYFDGHTETVTSGYIDNLDTQYLGTKLVTIGYKGETVQLMITTICAKIPCDICGYEYDLYPDGTNPGCPRCTQKTPVFTGKVLRYEEMVYSDEILNRLYTDGVYKFNLDDTFTISLNNKSNNFARGFLNKLFPSLSDRWFSLSESEKIGIR